MITKPSSGSWKLETLRVNKAVAPDDDADDGLTMFKDKIDTAAGADEMSYDWSYDTESMKTERYCRANSPAAYGSC